MGVAFTGGLCAGKGICSNLLQDSSVVKGSESLIMAFPSGPFIVV